MVLSWLGRSRRTASVDDLVARRRYGKAVDALRAEFDGRQPTVAERLRLADLLVLANRGSEALPILLGVADEQTRFGFTDKALEALRRASEVEPGRPDIGRRIATLRAAAKAPRTGGPARAAKAAPDWGAALDQAFPGAPHGNGDDPAAKGAAAEEREGADPGGAGAVTVGAVSTFEDEYLPESDLEPEPPLADGAWEDEVPELDLTEDDLEDEAPELHPSEHASAPPIEVVGKVKAGEPRPIRDWGDQPTQLSVPLRVDAMLRSAEAEREEAEAKHREAERRAAEAEREKAEARRRAAEAKRREAERLAAEAKRLEAERRAAEAKRREAERRAAEAERREAEARRREAEAKHREAEGRAAEAERRAAEAKHREAERRAAEAGRREAPEGRSQDPAEEELRQFLLALARASGSGRRGLGATLFADFPREELRNVRRGLTPHLFAPGDVVVSEGDRGDSLFIIASGSVRVLILGGHGQPFDIRRLDAGDFFGEVALLSGRPRTATVVAATPCQALEIHRTALEHLVRLRPAAQALMEEVASSRAQCQEEEAVRSLPPEAADPERAAAALQAHFGSSEWSPRVRTHLARLLLEVGRQDDALAILAGVAQDLARRGQAQKAITLLKKLERVRRRGVQDIELAPLRPGRRRSARHAPRDAETSGAPGEPVSRATTGAAFREWVGLLIRATDDLAARSAPSRPVEEEAEGGGDGQGRHLAG
ncbi:MAG: cyclic nucleotide-binding domain-containing protein [Acidobacteria bacterium]|jgi:CRP-like cAMP-binding protein|nr:cyclic nucleotide-binding domain-containing protein [Acidobacteriota bacterium]